MRALTPSIVSILIWFVAASASARDVNYMDMSKKEVVLRLGLPAQIWIGTGPEHEMWFYYYIRRDETFRVLSFGFRSGRVVSFGVDPEFRRSQLLSPDRPRDLARIEEWLTRNHLVR